MVEPAGPAMSPVSGRRVRAISSATADTVSSTTAINRGSHQRLFIMIFLSSVFIPSCVTFPALWHDVLTEREAVGLTRTVLHGSALGHRELRHSCGHVKR